MITANTVVAYDDAEHRYSLGNQRYWSASQIVERFRQPFDKQEQAAKYAAKHGNTAEYWVEQWEQKNLKSQVRGNRIHDANEITLQARMLDVIEGQVIPVHGELIVDEDPWFQRPDGVYLERKLWHHGYRAAGRADKIILLTDPNDPSIRYAGVEDYKTNERLDKLSYQFKNGTYKRMKPPIAHIMDSNWWHYQLQLSIYMFMLEYQGFRPHLPMKIIHYPHPTEENPNPVKEYHEVDYLKKEVILMLTYINR